MINSAVIGRRIRSIMLWAGLLTRGEDREWI
jgi:hypothetical protein